MLITVDETWDGAKKFRIPFRKFRIRVAAAAVNVKYGVDQPSDEMLGAEAGDWTEQKPGGEDFSFLQITNSGNQRVVFTLGDGNTGSDSLILSGALDLSDDAARLVGIMYGNLGQLAQQLVGGVNQLAVMERGFAYGASYKSLTLKAANTPDEVFSPAANANGAIVWRANFQTQSAANTGAAYVAKASAPATVIDGDVIVGTDALYTGVGAQTGASGKLERPVFIAAGKGFYYIATTLESLIGVRSVLYTLL